MKRETYEQMKERAAALLSKANIVITPKELSEMEVADYALDDVENSGLEIVVYENNDLYCAKEMILLPFQTCPEHRHDPIGDYKGKRETFRCRYGTVYLYVEGEPCAAPKAKAPKGVYTVRHEIVLNPGEQHTIMPGTKHWFQSGSQGAVVSEFSTSSFDEYDIFTDPAIKRIPVIED